jgi:hypothetical protein
MFVCCVLSGRRLCDDLITRPDESYRLRRVVVCDLETSWMRKPWPTGGCRTKNRTRQASITRKAYVTLNYVDFCDLFRHFRL